MALDMLNLRDLLDSRGEVPKATRYISLAFREEVQAGGCNLGVVTLQILFKTIRQDEIIMDSV